VTILRRERIAIMTSVGIQEKHSTETAMLRVWSGVLTFSNGIEA